MFRPAHLEPGQWSRSFEGTGHVATVPNICPYRERYPDSPSTALSQDRLWNLLWWEEEGGAGARPITGVPGPWPRPSVEPCLPPRLNPPPHQPSQASTLRPGRGCTPSCPPPQSSPHHRIQVRSRGLRMAGAARIGVSLTQLMPLDVTGALRSFSSRVRGTRPPQSLTGP